MSKQYQVMLSITMTEMHYINANSKKAAIKQAMQESDAVAAGGDAEVFEIVEVIE